MREGLRVTLLVEEVDVVPSGAALLWLENGTVKTTYRVVRIEGSQFAELPVSEPTVSDEDHEWLRHYQRGFSTAQRIHTMGLTLEDIMEGYPDDGSGFRVGVRSYVNLIREQFAN